MSRGDRGRAHKAPGQNTGAHEIETVTKSPPARLSRHREQRLEKKRITQQAQERSQVGKGIQAVG